VNDVPVIAIVDDDDSVRRSLVRVVQSAGYAAEGFGSAREFLDWLPQGRAACLLLDVHMNEMSGFDLQDRLAVPIIFITAHDDAKTQERIAKSSAVGHLRKPCEEQTVLAAIHRAVGGNGESPSGRDGAATALRSDTATRETDSHREDGGEA
jgi:two-component system, LuxR family, response regulator FixJ